MIKIQYKSFILEIDFSKIVDLIIRYIKGE